MLICSRPELQSTDEELLPTVEYLMRVKLSEKASFGRCLRCFTCITSFLLNASSLSELEEGKLSESSLIVTRTENETKLDGIVAGEYKIEPHENYHIISIVAKDNESLANDYAEIEDFPKETKKSRSDIRKTSSP